MKTILVCPHTRICFPMHNGAMFSSISRFNLEIEVATQAHCSVASVDNAIEIHRKHQDHLSVAINHWSHSQNLLNHEVLPRVYEDDRVSASKECNESLKIGINWRKKLSKIISRHVCDNLRMREQKSSESITGAFFAAGLSYLLISSAAMADTLHTKSSCGVTSGDCLILDYSHSDKRTKSAQGKENSLQESFIVESSVDEESGNDSSIQRESYVQNSKPIVAALCSAPSIASAATIAISSAAGATPIPVLQTIPSASGMRLLVRAMHHFGGGGVAGAVGATLVYPLDTIKTKMQAQLKKDGESSLYKNELDCLWKLIKWDGLGSLYSGLLPQLIGIAPEKAMKLTVNELLMEILENWMPGTGLWALELLAGGGGGFSQVVFTNPMEIVKIRLQTQAKSDVRKSIWDVVKDLGVQGLYNGAGVTIARDVPSSAIFFAGYALLRQLYPEHSFLAGCLAAVPATILTTPMDVVKTRLQMEPAPGEEAYKDAWDCFWRLLEKEGHYALFSGGTARVLRISPQFGITLLIYDALCPKL